MSKVKMNTITKQPEHVETIIHFVDYLNGRDNQLQVSRHNAPEKLRAVAIQYMAESLGIPQDATWKDMEPNYMLTQPSVELEDLDELTRTNLYERSV